MRSAGTWVAARRRSTAFGNVALPANETYQPRSSAVGSMCGEEKQWRTTVPAWSASPASVSASAARVDHDRLPELGGELELGSEEAMLVVSRRVVAKEVEPGLAHPDGLRMREQLAQRSEIVFGGRPRVVRVDAEDREYPVVPLRELER